MALSDPVLRALRHADQIMHETDRGDVFTVYDACRAAVSALSPLDDFYVAFVQPLERQIVYPYVFSNGRYVEAGSMTYGPSGVIAWVLASQRPYRFRDDQGALLNRGVRFGDDELSADAVVVPMVGTDGVVGVIGALSDTPDAFDDETVEALGWLAGVVLDRVRASDPGRRLNLSLVYPELAGDSRAGRLMAVSQTATALTQLAEEVEAIHAALAEGPADPAALGRLQAVSRRCFEVQASLVTRLGLQQGVDNRGEARQQLLAELSPRERAVVELVTGPDGDPGNAGIARELHIGTATVKSHMASALSKFGLSHRSELRWLINGAPD